MDENIIYDEREDEFDIVSSIFLFVSNLTMWNKLGRC